MKKFLKKRNVLLLIAFISLVFLISLFFGEHYFTKLSLASNPDSRNQGCYDLGGTCMEMGHSRPSGTCELPNGQKGSISPGLCMSRPKDMEWRCCVPDDEQEELQDDPVKSDDACEYMGGVCEWSNQSATGSLGECTVNGNSGCYIFGACRVESHSIRQGEFYLCCTDDEEFCGGGVDYTKWNDVYLNGDCPFSKPSESEDRLRCSQGPDTTPSHHRAETKPSVDIVLARDGAPGSEYFMAPDGGEIKRAKAFYVDGSEKCGCYLEFETDGGVTYEIRHCLLFAGVGQYYNQRTGEPMGKPLRVEKGEVLGRIADHSDTQVIDHAGGCSTGPHFHIKVTGGDVDRCVDCYFVDRLGCNLYNIAGASNPGQCGRCYRESGPPECFSYDWGALCNLGLGGCNLDSKQYCCESDRTRDWDEEKEEWGPWYCVCPHTSPSKEKAPGFGDMF